MKTNILLSAAAAIIALGLSVAQANAEEAKKKAEGHCEKVENGEHKDLDAPADTTDAKKWCKEQGGKWQKGKKHDEQK